ncbi:nuclear nucleic acid-binding protein C1D-like [Xenia sp. Carnegie-2017]|uniref:nuclear nucleic acid-binding protein C1D-like n=1 Tax=Xenia sp. Carnegie-2017 TaxID=2897299 RepID=UPI001F04DAC0|nr:nuclear nucleic acid-binding protein C1D-like [Xenia sp. Carnegie-2017]
MAASRDEENELPNEIFSAMKDFHHSFGSVEETLEPLLRSSNDELHEKLDVLDRAKLDLMVVYGINTMFWIYLITQGVNPKEHGVKHELDRIKNYMKKVKDVSERKKASMKIDKDAARRFVKGALANPKASEVVSDKEKRAKTTKQKNKNKRWNSGC